MITNEEERRRRAMFAFMESATNPQAVPVPALHIRKTCAKLLPTIAAIRAGRTDLKKSLPAVCWAATFKDNHRHAESADPTGLAYIDIDHVYDNLVRLNQAVADDTTPDKYVKCRYAHHLYSKLFHGFEEQLGIVHAQISPSGDGLHIVFIPRVGNSIEEAQKAFAEDSGLEFYDTQCKDISRLMFLSSTEDTLYDALDLLYQ